MTPIADSSSTTRRQCLSAAIVMAGLLTSAGGCNQTPRTAREAFADYNHGNFAAAAALLKPEITKKDENFVLTNCRFAICALAAGHFADAEDAFMSASDVMNGVNTNEGSRTLGATVVFEGIKVWKGEPFERAMAHYYLGVLFLMKHDYNNARAAFQNSLFKIREYAKKDDLEHYKEADSNFALGYFGLGFCNLRMGKLDLADASFKKAESIDPRLAHVIAEVQKPGINTLIFVDAGHGPHKEGKGWYNEESAFGPTPAEAGPVQPVFAYIDGTLADDPHAYASFTDTLAMAQQRSWQDIDTLRKVKAVIGTGLMAGGAGVAVYGAERHDTGTALAGLGAIALGAALSASSQADLRSWEMLPRNVYIIPAVVPPGPHSVVVRVGASESVPFAQNPVFQVSGPAGPVDNVFYFRLR